MEERENTFLEELLKINFCHIKIRYDSMTELCVILKIIYTSDYVTSVYTWCEDVRMID